MADEFEQTKRQANLIVRGLKHNENNKTSILNMMTKGLDLKVTEQDIKFVVKIVLKNEMPDTDSLKVAFHDSRLRDEVYARRLKLKGTHVFISEDLTLKRSELAFQARKYVRTTPNASSWTSNGHIYLKDSQDDKPRIIHHKTDLKPADNAPLVSSDRGF